MSSEEDRDYAWIRWPSRKRLWPLTLGLRCKRFATLTIMERWLRRPRRNAKSANSAAFLFHILQESQVFSRVWCTRAEVRMKKPHQQFPD